VQTTVAPDRLVIAGTELRSRLFLGTGKYRSEQEMLDALEAAGTELVTVAIRRLDLDDPRKRTILDAIDWKRYRTLPNTAGCATAEEAVRIARLARSMGLSDWVKLEVIPDPRHLLPNPLETLKAAAVLVREGFTVLPYINAAPVLARGLADFFIGRIEAPVADVLADRAAEEQGFLRDDRNRSAQLPQPDCGKVGPVQQNPPGLRNVETRHKVNHGRLPCARRPDERDDFAGPDFCAESIEYRRRARFVRKGYRFEDDAPAHVLKRHGIWRVRRVGCKIETFIAAPGADDAEAGRQLPVSRQRVQGGPQLALGEVARRPNDRYNRGRRLILMHRHTCFFYPPAPNVRLTFDPA